jgi:hypothetical protein
MPIAHLAEARFLWLQPPLPLIFTYNQGALSKGPSKKQTDGPGRGWLVPAREPKEVPGLHNVLFFELSSHRETTKNVLNKNRQKGGFVFLLQNVFCTRVVPLNSHR